MTGQPVQYDDELTLSELVDRVQHVLQTLWSARLVLVRWALGGVLVGLMMAFGSGAEFTASTKLVPYMRQADAGGLAGLAGLAGVRLPTGMPDQVLTADLYPEVARSRDFRAHVAQTPIGFSGLGRTLSPVTYFTEGYRPGLLVTVGKYTIGLPRVIINALRPSSTTTVDVGDSLRIVAYPRSLVQTLQELEDRLQVGIDRKTGIVTIRGTMPDAYASAALVKTASAQLMLRIVEYQSQKAGEELRFVQAQYEQSRRRFERAQVLFATSTDRNRRTLTATSQVEAQRVQAEYELALTVYRQLSSELEQARIRMNRDTPVFTVLEEPIVPDQRSSPRRGLRLVSCTLIALLIGGGRVLWRHWRSTPSSGPAIA
jgi:uncharacterized protein involved in exopolysaccharide biosynthesis